MIKEWFTTKYRTIPVYAEENNKQVAVIVEVKYSFMHDFQPMSKTCLSDSGELIEKPAVFDNYDDALDYITRLNTSL